MLNFSRKIITFFLIFSSILGLFPHSLADDFLEENLSTDSTFYTETISESSSSVTNEPILNSKYAIAVDRKSGSILYEKNSKDITPMASTTKIMTCIIAIEKTNNLDEIVVISKKASSIHGSTLGIKENMKIPLKSLLYGLMLRSGNDCAIAIAEHISGSVENFCVEMNNKAKTLGLKNTNFTSPHGLDNENHYTTAYELAKITDYALKNDIFKEIVSTKNTTISLGNSIININNTNELLGNLNGVYGVKTGFTFNSGRCLVSSCKRNNLDIIVIVLGADTKNFRTKDSIQIIEYIFNNFENIDTEELLFSSFNNYCLYYKNNVIIEKSYDIPILLLEKKENYIFPINKKNINSFRIKIHCIQKLSFLEESNSQIGTISVYNSDKLLYTSNILLKNKLNKKSFLDYFYFIFKNYFNFMNI